jgi:RNA polymerase sigma-70 factor, ECF subfamily
MNPGLSFESLIERHSAEIFSYLWRLLHYDMDAEDCLQETFLRAFRAFPRLAVDANHRAWLYRIATNLAFTHLKRRNSLAAQTADVDPDRLSTPVDFSSGLEREEILAEVLQAVISLPEKQRAALLMRKYQGLEYAEIAQVLRCSQTAARAGVYQALKKLRTQLAQEERT